MTNCFTFSPFSGFTPGIAVAENVPHRSNGTMLRPHVSVGPIFCQIDYVLQPKVEDGLLVSARIREVTPSFSKGITLLSSIQGSRSLIVLVDINRVPSFTHRRIDPSAVNAWVDFQTNGHIVVKHNITGRCLVEFTKDEQAMLVFDRDGAVYRIVRRNGAMIVDPLSLLEMAKERVVLMRSQVEEYPANLRGIIAGAIRLLKTSAKHKEVRNVLVDFLADYADGRMNDFERKDVYNMLGALNDPRAYMFAEGYSFSVVSFDRERTKRAKPRDTKADRRGRDRLLRAKMRGSSNGGGKKHVTT